MLIRNLKEDDLKDLLTLWNAEYNLIYPISMDLLKRNTRNANWDLSYGIIEDNHLIGFLIGKTYEEDYLKTYLDQAWISLMFVKRSFRKKGYGSKLLERFINDVKNRNKKIINLGKDLNNFFPGLPIDLTSSKKFFLDNGFEASYLTHDLICRKPVKGNLSNKDFLFTHSSRKDKGELLDFIIKNWPGRWAYEINKYFDDGGSGKEIIVCKTKDQKIIGFAKVGYPSTREELISYSQTWRTKFARLGGIGPLGIDKEYRGLHLGLDIVKASINAIADDASEIIIDWTGLLDFYRQLGFEVWKAYYYLSKPL